MALSNTGNRVVEGLRTAADIFAERNAIYQDNFREVGTVMEALFPDGVTLSDKEDFVRWHLFELAIVKLTRYTNNYHDGGHKDSIDDMIVYLSMVAALDEESRDEMRQPEGSLVEDSDEPLSPLDYYSDWREMQHKVEELIPGTDRAAKLKIWNVKRPSEFYFLSKGDNVRFFHHMGKGQRYTIEDVAHNGVYLLNGQSLVDPRFLYPADK